MASCQSHRAYNVPLLSPSSSTSPLDADRDTPLLSTSSKAIPSSLERLNDYIQKHYDQFVAHESLKRILLASSSAEKEKGYKRQIVALKAIHTDIASLLLREQAANAELRQKLDSATSSMARLCQVVTDANFIFVDRKRPLLEIKQEEGSQESTDVSDITICPNAAISALLSQIESVFTEMNGLSGAGLPPAVDPSPFYSIAETLEKVVYSLLAAQRTFALLHEDFKSVDAARADAGLQNKSLQEKVTLLQEELNQARDDNDRISRELTTARLEREEHVCRRPTPVCPAPAAQDEFPISLPSPPLEKRDFLLPDDILQETSKISRKVNHTLPGQAPSENTHLSPATPVEEARPLSSSASTSCGRQKPAPTSTSCGRQKISLSDAIKRVHANPTSSTTQNGPPKSPTVRNDQQTVGPSIPSPSVPIRGIKRTSSGVHKCQNVSQGPPSSLLTSALTTPSIPDKTSKPPTQKKRRVTGTSDAAAANQGNKPPNETLSKPAISIRTPVTTVGPSLPSSSKHVAMPKTNASDLKSLKFNKKPQPSKPPSTPTTATSPNTLGPITTPKKSDKSSMRPLDLAKKSPQERAAIRKSK